jgi:RNA polymerase sigma-70 factor (ECF subfamily)
MQTAAPPIFVSHLLPVLTSDAFFRVCLRLTHDRTEAEDLVADTSLRSLERVDQYDSGRPAFAWLSTVASNLASNKRRRASRDASAKASMVRPASGPGPDELIDKARMADLVEAAVDDLPPRQAAVLRARFWGDNSAREATAALGIPYGSGLSRTFRAVATLRETLAA